MKERRPDVVWCPAMRNVIMLFMMLSSVSLSPVFESFPKRSVLRRSRDWPGGMISLLPRPFALSRCFLDIDVRMKGT